MCTIWRKKWTNSVDSLVKFSTTGSHALSSLLSTTPSLESKLSQIETNNSTGFYIYGRFWSPSANGHQKNGLYNIFYERLENTKKILNISSLKMHQHLVLMSVYFKTGYINWTCYINSRSSLGNLQFLNESTNFHIIIFILMAAYVSLFRINGFISQLA